MRLARAIAMLALLASAGLAGDAGAVTLGQQDNFEDSTTQGWIVAQLGGAHPFPPVNQPSGGPTGADDSYLLLTAGGGSGPGSRLAVINLDQWSGDYLAADVGAIAMDLRNQGTTDLYIRLLFEDPGSGPPANVAATDAVFVPAGGGWTHVVFAIGVPDLTTILGDAATVLANTTAVRIYHDPNPVFPPEPIVALLGVDNIQAQSGTVSTRNGTWGGIKSMYR
ncbi:MAG: hypothetical protein IPM94_14540 [bacterium]|nr:hypothetical protein [bacterium]